MGRHGPAGPTVVPAHGDHVEVELRNPPTTSKDQERLD